MLNIQLDDQISATANICYLACNKTRCFIKYRTKHSNIRRFLPRACRMKWFGNNAAYRTKPTRFAFSVHTGTLCPWSDARRTVRFSTPAFLLHRRLHQRPLPRWQDERSFCACVCACARDTERERKRVSLHDSAHPDDHPNLVTELLHPANISC